MRKLFYLLLLPFCLWGCKKTDQPKIDDQIIQQYISDHHLNATAEPDGLYYVPIATGLLGGNPTVASTVTVNYKGYLSDGTVFDQSSAPIALPLSQTIYGWQEGIPLMKKGGKATLLIPSALGYGASSPNNKVPANSVLIFDVELVSFQ
ncbi:MAG: FKBP-type peptidyl-prolyl cis-trans isomerase [Bacteroidota bacterium]|nr:FKBP-type peptidyl-prolyl cis-trans isomerase [Bacteroidota bacterium]